LSDENVALVKIPELDFYRETTFFVTAELWTNRHQISIEMFSTYQPLIIYIAFLQGNQIAL
jgi:hypothetical protein